MKLFIFHLFFSSMVFFSCTSSSEPENHQFEAVVPLGTWVYSGNDDSLSIYYSASQFEQDKPGIAFEKEYIFIERTAGWCGTPPLTYSNVEGKWEVFDNNTMKITCSNWINENYGRLMEIVFLSDTELKVLFRSVPE